MSRRIFTLFTANLCEIWRMAAVRFSAAGVLKNLAGIYFPAGKQELIEAVRANGAEEDVLALLQADLPNGTYRRPTDVLEALGRHGDQSYE